MLFDLIIIAIILIMAAIGLSKGLFSSIFSFAGKFFPLIISFIFVKPVASALSKTSFLQTVNNLSLKILNSIGGIMNSSIPSHDALVEALSEKFPKIIANMLASSLDSYTGVYANQTVAQILTPTLSSILMTIISFILLYFVTLLLLSMFRKLGNSLNSVVIIGPINKLLGFVFGFLEGIIVVSLLLLILSLFTGNDTFTPVFELINKSVLGNYMYNNNFILVIAGRLLTQYVPTLLPSPTPIS